MSGFEALAQVSASFFRTLNQAGDTNGSKPFSQLSIPFSLIVYVNPVSAIAGLHMRSHRPKCCCQGMGR